MRVTSKLGWKSYLSLLTTAILTVVITWWAVSGGISGDNVGGKLVLIFIFCAGAAVAVMTALSSVQVYDDRAVVSYVVFSRSVAFRDVEAISMEGPFSNTLVAGENVTLKVKRQWTIINASMFANRGEVITALIRNVLAINPSANVDEYLKRRYS